MTTLLEILPFDNLLAWFVQVLILVGVGAVGMLALRHPRARLWFWQAVLLAAVLLPFVEPRRVAPPSPPIPTKASFFATATTARPAIPVAPSPFEWRPEYLLGILAAGATLRFAWIAAGLIRLRHYRRDARRVDSPIPFEGAKITSTCW